jgi:UrcA family protein
VVVSGIIAWGGGGAAQAAEPSPPATHKVVSFRDLNLDNPEGVAVLYRRIKVAAHEVCADPYRYDMSELALRPCIDDAMSRAIAQVNSPLLTSLYEEKTGKVNKKSGTLAQAR